MENKHLIPIGGDKNDPFYRYKRNQIALTYRKGRTYISNLTVIAHQLGLPEAILKKELFKRICKAGYGSNKDSFTGRLEVEQVERILEKFIAKHILCKRCGYPEIDFGKGICKACGTVRS